jgi:osmoprotectant transport system ATP-binding protein
MTGVAVEFAGVCKRFDGSWGLENVDLRLPEGQTSAIVGESGSGKSTLLQLINAVYRPDRGTIRVLGEAIPDKDVHLWRRKIGYAIQGAGLFPHLTVRDNITLLGRLSQIDTDFIERRRRTLMELMGLSQDLDARFPHLLSGGEQQRVGLCRALLLQPKLLLLDEPFSALDPIARIGLYDLFVELRDRESVSTVLVTHDIREALRLADHLVILRGGVLQQSGDVSSVVASPANDYVRMLLTDQLA